MVQGTYKGHKGVGGRAREMARRRAKTEQLERAEAARIKAERHS